MNQFREKNLCENGNIELNSIKYNQENMIKLKYTTDPSGHHIFAET